jgi:hypothetical protein
MGTEISLSLGGLDIDWSKNSRGNDHGMLFQEKDRLPVRSQQIDYDYFQESGEDPTDMEMAFVRRLEDVVPRLELLGFTLDQARAAYDDWAEAWRDEQESFIFGGEDRLQTPLTFDEYCAFVNRQPVAELDDTLISFEDRAEEDRRIKGRFAEDEALIARIPREIHGSNTAYSERSFFGSAVVILNPYLTLRVLAENPINRETDLVWQYGPLVVGGYAAVGEFAPRARRTETFLIVTEGSSDAHILNHALALLRPEILDFFRFIDVSERHPFAGTGNLVKFAEGLAKIDVQNQILFVFDNDAEGVDAFQKVGALTLPANMRAMLLPDLDAFRQFPARGPEGEHLADINGRAAAIECYLDHQLRDYPPPRIVWTNYKKETDTYQGALEHKESYMRAFMDLRAHSLGGYATDKIAQVLDALVAECVAIARDDVARRFDLESD